MQKKREKMVRVEFEYSESESWEVFVSGAVDEKEAYQAFNAVLKTCKPIIMAVHPTRKIGERIKIIPVMVIS